MHTTTCTRCRAVKPVTEFGTDSRRASGRKARCRACEAELARERRARPPRSPGLVLAMPARTDPGEPDPPAGSGREDQDDAGADEDLYLGPYAAALEKTLKELSLRDVDAAAVSVARGLARAMDGAYGDPNQVTVISPRYIAALKALRATRDTAKDLPTRPPRQDASNF